MSGSGFLAPDTVGLLQPLWEATARGELLLPQCVSGHRFFVPEPVCPQCLSPDWNWVPCGGTGSLYSWSTVYRAPVPDAPVPYVIAVVELDDGWTLMTHLVGVEPEDVTADMRVRVSFRPARNETTLPMFTAEGEDA